MDDKIYLAERVYKISEQYNLTQTTVKEIISEYVDYSRNSLLSGDRIDFLGLLYIEPNITLKKYKSTLGYTCSKVADILGLPRHTVYVVVHEYLASLKEGLFEGKTAEIRGIVTVHPIYTDGKLTNIHSAISTTIKKTIQESNCKIDSVRVHTYKSLKEEITNANK